MAIPTITSLDPAAGFTVGDNIVIIIGTNFLLPTVAPPGSGYLGGEQAKTVSVQYEGQESEWSYAASSTMIVSRVPEYRGPHDQAYPVALDVRVANLDPDGVEIPTENVTSADAYSVDRPSLAGETYFQSVVRSFIHLFKRHVLLNTHTTMSRDAEHQSEIDKRFAATAPAINLIGPRTGQDRDHNFNTLDAVEDPADANAFIRKRHGVSLDFVFDLIIYAKGSGHLFALQESCIKLFRDVTEIRVPDDPAVPDGDYIEYEIEMPWLFEPVTEDDPNSSDLFMSRAGVVIRGVQVDSVGGTIVQRGRRITSNDGDPTLEIEVPQ
ncbi:IPT/TIG domain-containing protein [Candidatus Pacearchaeota archaeon]|nr:IPT/TIG domain-containing protein [Candidatus Pacearchaeota archaeon]